MSSLFNVALLWLKCKAIFLQECILQRSAMRSILRYPESFSGSWWRLQSLAVICRYNNCTWNDCWIHVLFSCNKLSTCTFNHFWALPLTKLTEWVQANYCLLTEEPCSHNLFTTYIELPTDNFTSWKQRNLVLVFNKM